MPEEKTVFILGAGFSRDANIPLQGELLPEVLKRDGAETIKSFINRVYGLDSNAAANLALEDVYTPIHQAVTNGQYLKSYGVEALKEIERTLNLLIAQVIDDCVGPAEYAHKFVEYLQKQAAPKSDKFSIISLNWDIMLDKILFQKLKEDKDETNKERGTLDYCCHTTGIDEKNPIMPGIIASERKKYAIKLMKLHGSLNWVSCPQCSRLFINQTEKEGIRAFNRTAECPKCDDDIHLEAELALPTFQKDLKRFHFQHIWNQAGIELSEAAKLVFIGYSFPLADFDFRALITKHLPTNAHVDVVLHTTDECKGTGKGYLDYFGHHRCSIRYDGVESYVDELTSAPAPTP